MDDLKHALDVVKQAKAALEEAKEQARLASDAHQAAIAAAEQLHKEFTDSISDLLPSVAKGR